MCYQYKSIGCTHTPVYHSIMTSFTKPSAIFPCNTMTLFLKTDMLMSFWKSLSKLKPALKHHTLIFSSKGTHFMPLFHSVALGFVQTDPKPVFAQTKRLAL